MTPRAADLQRACSPMRTMRLPSRITNARPLTYSVAHEIGHLIGARHDLNIDKTDDAVPLRPRLRQWNKMAGHYELQGELWRLPASAGVVQSEGDDQRRARRHAELDNARVIAEQAARVANFRFRGTSGSTLQVPSQACPFPASG